MSEMNAINADAFKTAEVPEDIYPTKDNPYAGMVAAIVASGMETDPKTGKLRSKESRAAVLPYKTDDEVKAVENVIRLAQLAGKDATYQHNGETVTGVTVKKLVKADGKGKATLTLWAVERITRTAKEAASETSE